MFWCRSSIRSWKLAVCSILINEVCVVVIYKCLFWSSRACRSWKSYYYNRCIQSNIVLILGQKCIVLYVWIYGNIALQIYKNINQYSVFQSHQRVWEEGKYGIGVVSWRVTGWAWFPVFHVYYETMDPRMLGCYGVLGYHECFGCYSALERWCPSAIYACFGLIWCFQCVLFL